MKENDVVECPNCLEDEDIQVETEDGALFVADADETDQALGPATVASCLPCGHTGTLETFRALTDFDYREAA